MQNINIVRYNLNNLFNELNYFPRHCGDFLTLIENQIQSPSCFIKNVKQYQLEKKLLKIDGILGKQTLKKIREDLENSNWTQSMIILMKNILPLTSLYSRVTFSDVPLGSKKNIALQEMQYGDYALRLTKNLPINIWCGHWDCSFLSAKTAQILQHRENISVDSLLDRDGTFYLTAPSENFYFYHGNAISQYSIGTEIANPFDLKYEKQLKKIWPNLEIPIWEEVIPRGRKMKYIGFTEQQINRLTRALQAYKNCIKAQKIKVIIDPDYFYDTYLSGEKKLSKEKIKEIVADKETFYIVGHYHFNLNKIDPGITLMEILSDRLSKEES
jgi:hypothetical protein